MVLKEKGLKFHVHCLPPVVVFLYTLDNTPNLAAIVNAEFPFEAYINHIIKTS